jgi:hypothetical protein
MTCRFCNKEIAIVPDVLRYLGRKEYYDVKRTDNDSDGRYATLCDASDTGDHEPLLEE